MEAAFENQNCIEVRLVHVYDGSLVPKTDEKSLSNTATFLTSTIESRTLPNIESILSVAQ